MVRDQLLTGDFSHNMKLLQVCYSVHFQTFCQTEKLEKIVPHKERIESLNKEEQCSIPKKPARRGSEMHGDSGKMPCSINYQPPLPHTEWHIKSGSEMHGDWQNVAFHKPESIPSGRGVSITPTNGPADQGRFRNAWELWQNVQEKAIRALSGCTACLS